MIYAIAIVGGDGSPGVRPYRAMSGSSVSSSEVGSMGCCNYIQDIACCYCTQGRERLEDYLNHSHSADRFTPEEISSAFIIFDKKQKRRLKENCSWGIFYALAAGASYFCCPLAPPLTVGCGVLAAMKIEAGARAMHPSDADKEAAVLRIRVERLKGRMDTHTRDRVAAHAGLVKEFTELRSERVAAHHLLVEEITTLKSRVIAAPEQLFMGISPASSSSSSGRFTADSLRAHGDAGSSLPEGGVFSSGGDK